MSQKATVRSAAVVSKAALPGRVRGSSTISCSGSNGTCVRRWLKICSIPLVRFDGLCLSASFFFPVVCVPSSWRLVARAARRSVLRRLQAPKELAPAPKLTQFHFFPRLKFVRGGRMFRKTHLRIDLMQFECDEPTTFGLHTCGLHVARLNMCGLQACGLQTCGSATAS